MTVPPGGPVSDLTLQPNLQWVLPAAPAGTRWKVDQKEEGDFGMQERVTDIRTITLSMPFGLGTVNCFLVDTGDGFVLVDTGTANRRAELEGELASAGCKWGDLKLIVLTHGDFDHTGNAAYLRKTFGAQIAMHRDDLGMAEEGDMFRNRSSGNALTRLLTPILLGFSKSHRFTPDFFLEEGDDLSPYGFDAQVLSIPGHSQGAIGILTAASDLFCGDLFESTKAPATNSIMDDPMACGASLGKLQGFRVGTVYPGHGQPFPMADFLAGQRANGDEA
jgi:glyoxylase-like metal-dependent hydrolase (beta-lactamase superfamily II)